MKSRRAAELHSEVVTLRKVAIYLNCSYATVFRMVHQGVLPGFRLGGSGDWRFLRSAVDQWIAARQVHPPGKGGKKTKRKGAP
jgi:excisionase family DNA binding protein